MNELKSDFVYPLLKPIKYPFNGEQKEGRALLMIAPLAKLNKQRTILQRELMKAINTVTERNANRIEVSSNMTDAQVEIESGDRSVTQKEVNGMLLSGEANFDVMHDALKSLMLNGCCKIENEAPMLESVYDSLDGRDLDGMLSAFVANFIMPSL